MDVNWDPDVKISDVFFLFSFWCVNREINVIELFLEMAKKGPLSIWGGLFNVCIRTLSLSQAK